MARKYNVKIVDEKGNLILQFIGTVVGKQQPSGRSGIGPVEETLITSSVRFYDGTGAIVKINKAKKQP